MSAAPGPGSTTSVSADPESDLPPEDPRLAQMRRLVTILLVVLIVGVSTVVIALLLKLKDLTFAAAPPVVERAGEQALPGLKPGERLIAAEADVDRITLLLEGPDGERRAVVLDGRTFQPLGAVTD